VNGDYILDAGALGMLAEDNIQMRAMLLKISGRGGHVFVPAVVLAECLGDARHDPSYYRALKDIGGLDECVIDLGAEIARRAGSILKHSRSRETIDGLIVAAAESLGSETRIVTGDRVHLERLVTAAAVRLGVLELNALSKPPLKSGRPK